MSSIIFSSRCYCKFRFCRCYSKALQLRIICSCIISCFYLEYEIFCLVVTSRYGGLDELVFAGICALEFEGCNTLDFSSYCCIIFVGSLLIECEACTFQRCGAVFADLLSFDFVCKYGYLVIRSLTMITISACIGIVGVGQVNLIRVASRTDYCIFGQCCTVIYNDLAISCKSRSCPGLEIFILFKRNCKYMIAVSNIKVRSYNCFSDFNCYFAQLICGNIKAIAQCIGKGIGLVGLVISKCGRKSTCDLIGDLIADIIIGCVLSFCCLSGCVVLFFYFLLYSRNTGFSCNFDILYNLQDITGFGCITGICCIRIFYKVVAITGNGKR